MNLIALVWDADSFLLYDDNSRRVIMPERTVKPINEAEFLARVSEILQRTEGQYKPVETDPDKVQIEGLTIDLKARRVHFEGRNIDFEAGSVMAWEKNIYLSQKEYETFANLAHRLGVSIDQSGYLVRVSGDDLEIPIVLYVSQTSE
jgi:DNA-binding response OmpR family regulator